MRATIIAILLLLISLACSNTGKKAKVESGSLDMPTSDTMAYNYYLQGEDYHNRSTLEDDKRLAFQMYEKAVEIDPNFALAWAGLAATSRSLYWFGYDKSEENLGRTKEYLDKALSLAPDLKEVRVEEAYYYYHCKLDYPKSLQILEELRSGYPDDDRIVFIIGLLYRRMGEFKKSLDNNNEAIRLNPSEWNYWTNAAGTSRTLRDYDNAEKFLLQAIDLNPSNSNLYVNLFNLYLSLGQMQKAGGFLKNNEKLFDSNDLKQKQAQLELFSGNYKAAIEITQSLPEEALYGQNFYYSKHLNLGLIYRSIPDNAMAVKQFEAERNFLIGKIHETDNDYRIYSSLGIAYAGLGIKEQALEAGKKALEIYSFDIDKYGPTDTELDMVRILVMVGEYDEALTRLDQIIRLHGDITAESLSIDPFWDPVRNMEKFKEIVTNPDYKLI